MASATDDPFALAGTTLEGRFAVERVVARGGFGIVYLGRHLALQKAIALKVLFIPRELDPEEKRMFLDGFALEARMIAQLDHPAIVRVFDFGVSRSPNGREMPWMVLDWIEGQSLADFLKARRGQPMSPREALAVLRPVFQGLAYAHEMHVAHRDIKPSNIMLAAGRGSAQGAPGPTKLLDFGIAKAMSPDDAVGSGETQTHALFAAFSLPYAAPEQKAAMKTGPWTDVHALGLILTEFLTGQCPYSGTDRIEVEQRIMALVRPTPALFHVDVGVWEPVIARAVSLRSPDRFQDAGSFLAALEATIPDARVIALNEPGSTEPVRFGQTPLGIAAPSVPISTITASPTASRVPRAPATSMGRLVAVAAGVGVMLAGVVTAVLIGSTSGQPSTAASPSEPSTASQGLAPRPAPPVAALAAQPRTEPAAPPPPAIAQSDPSQHSDAGTPHGRSRRRRFRPGEM